MSGWATRRTGQRRGFRRGEVFPVRLIPEERSQLEQARDEHAGPQGLGPFMVWATLHAAIAGVLPRRLGSTCAGAPGRVVPGQAEAAAVIPARAGITGARVLPGPGPGIAQPRDVADRVILDLCAGSGAWSEPYARAGYRVIPVTLPDDDVRRFAPTGPVWGVLAAPPCDQFSLARNGHDSPRDFESALEIVIACLRIIALARPKWWALENPVGLLGRWLGTPLDVWEPFEFGDPWTKRTAVWGDFTIPTRGPFVEPQGSAMDRPTSAARSITPPGFARAFFEANP